MKHHGIFQGKEILKQNKFFSDLCNLMKNVEFIEFYDEYFKDWSNIQCMIFYMKLYSTIEYEYSIRYDELITDNTMTYMLKQIMSNKKTRRYAFDLFKDFRDISHKNTGSFRTLLNFDNENKITKKTKKLDFEKINILDLQLQILELKKQISKIN